MGNILIMTTMETVAEVNVFAEKSGLGTQNMKKLMDQMFPKPPHSIYNKRMLDGDYYQEPVRTQKSDVDSVKLTYKQPMVEVSKARKLTAHVLELAKSTGTSVKAYEAAVEHLKVVEDHAGGNADINGIYGAVRLESGLPYENRNPSE